MHHCVVDGRRVRVQILAFVALPVIARNSEYARKHGIDANTVIPPEGLVEPIAVRAPTGHRLWH